MTCVRSRGLLALLVVAVVAAGAVVAVTVLREGNECGAERVADPRSVLQSATTMADRPDEYRDALAAAIGSMAAPFGEVDAGIDYYYKQWLHLYGATGGVLAWTQDNAPVTYLDDEDLEPRWSLRPATKRTAWDASAQSFLLLELADDAPVAASSYGLGSGEQRWCTELTLEHRAGEPVASTFLDDGDVVVALPDATGIQLTRLSGDDGDLKWVGRTTAAARADYLGPLGEDQLVVGGVEEHRLAQPGKPLATGQVAALDAESFEVVWAWTPQGSAVHVVGVVGGSVLATERLPSGTDLVSLDDGIERWRTRIAGGGFEATLRGDVVLTRSRTGLDAYDATSGTALWQRDLPTDRTYFPYGFGLGQMPSLDEDHVLMPTTTSLDVLDLGDGTTATYPLPTDGVSSTYWPYQLLVTENHLGVLTNTGTVLARRE